MIKKVKKKVVKNVSANKTAAEIRKNYNIDTVAKANQFKKDNKPANVAGNRKVNKVKKKVNRKVVKQTKKATR